MSTLLDHLRANPDKRGLAADLRSALAPSRAWRAWPVLGAFRLLDGSWESEVAALTAKLYALHPLDTDTGNFGATCLALCGEEETPWAPDAQPGPMSRRLQRLLAAERHDVGPMLLRLVTYARGKNVPVNYSQLEQDLRRWSETVRLQWARAFWTPSAAREEAAASGEEDA